MEEESVSVSGSSEDEEDMEAIEMEEEEKAETKAPVSSKVFLPGQEQGEEEGEELVHDRSAYRMYHAAATGAPCLSFDIIRDSLGESRSDFPLTCYLIAGTQAELGRQNHIIIMKMSELMATQKEEEEVEEDDDLLDDNEPQLETVMIQHSGAVNRIRMAKRTQRQLVATWSDKGVVHIWDTTKHVVLVDSPSVGNGATHQRLKGHQESPLFTYQGHQTEGYALDWSTSVPGRLATGDCHRDIHIWQPREEGVWQVDSQPMVGHTHSVEDIQWSPNEPSVFASCSVDQTIRIWDCRAKPAKACMLSTHAHSSDVNVISWNREEPLLVSGGDDGELKIWDLRQFKKGEAAAMFKHHSAPITSVEWAWHDHTVFASAGADDQVVQWDLAVEKDGSETVALEEVSPDLEKIPPQLLFIHLGQQEVKELHWHPQLPGVTVTTALSGFNIFRTISV